MAALADCVLCCALWLLEYPGIVNINNGLYLNLCVISSIKPIRYQIKR